MRRAGAACALAGLVLGAPTQAACWSPAERTAAQVRELQTMLMVASLRCRAAGIDITGDYNGFVRASRNTIEAANLQIKTHFAAEGGAQADYDRFTTVLANHYGDAPTDAATCAEAAGIAHAAMASAAELAHKASTVLFPRALPGDTCTAPTPAGAAPASPPVIVTIAAAAPARPVLRLPDEVTAALAVMARYGAQPAAIAAPAPRPATPTQLAAVAH